MSPTCPPLPPPGPLPERPWARRFVHLRRHDETCALPLGEKYALRALRLPETSSADPHPSERGRRGRPSAFHGPRRSAAGGGGRSGRGQRRCFRLFRHRQARHLQPLTPEHASARVRTISGFSERPPHPTRPKRARGYGAVVPVRSDLPPSPFRIKFPSREFDFRGRCPGPGQRAWPGRDRQPFPEPGKSILWPTSRPVPPSWRICFGANG